MLIQCPLHVIFIGVTGSSPGPRSAKLHINYHQTCQCKKFQREMQEGDLLDIQKVDIKHA